MERNPAAPRRSTPTRTQPTRDTDGSQATAPASRRRRARGRGPLALPALLTALALTGTPASAALMVSPSSDPDLLANEIVGPGVRILGAPTYRGEADQSATFTGGLDAGLGIDAGLMLTTGDAGLAPGPNAAPDSGVALGTPGFDPARPDSFDAAVLEFDFRFGDGSRGGDLAFDFLFASEEYHESVFFGASFADRIRILIDGVNVARAPNGDPVSIDTVNCGTDGGSGGPNCAHLNDNDPGAATTAFNVEYDGFTDPLTARASGLAPGTHTATFMIEDIGDRQLDSSLLVGNASFSAQPVPAPRVTALLATGLLALFAACAARGHRPRAPYARRSAAGAAV